MPVSYFNVNAILMVILYFPANFAIANFVFKRLGLYLALCIGLVLNCVCLLFRTFINYEFLLAMIGGFFFGIAQPLIMNSNTELASNWFDTGEVFFLILIENNCHNDFIHNGSYRFRGWIHWVYVFYVT